MTWEYLAGFTDADGCIGIEHKQKLSGKYASVRLRWSQKAASSMVLDEIAEFLVDAGVKVSVRNFSVALDGHKYPQRELCLTNNESTRKILTKLLPHLILKKDRAIRALKVLDYTAQLKEAHGYKYRSFIDPTQVEQLVIA